MVVGVLNTQGVVGNSGFGNGVLGRWEDYTGAQRIRRGKTRIPKTAVVNVQRPKLSSRIITAPNKTSFAGESLSTKSIDSLLSALKESKESLEPSLLEIIEPRSYTPQVLSILSIWFVGSQTMVSVSFTNSHLLLRLTQPHYIYKINSSSHVDVV